MGGCGCGLGWGGFWSGKLFWESGFRDIVKYFRMSFRVSTFVGDKNVLRIY